MKVWVITARVGSRIVPMEVAANTEEEIVRAVRADQWASKATDIKILGELREPRVLRWLPVVPSKGWIAYRNTSPRTFVFDGDDTLWHVEWKYSQAYADFFSYLYRIVREDVPNIHFLYKVFFGIEDKKGTELGIRRGRVAESMAETYRQICTWIKHTSGREIYDSRHEARIRAIGDQPFDAREHLWISGAEETLQSLRDEGHTLCLLTKYDRSTWPEKADLLHVSRFFDAKDILVVERRKQMPDFLELAREAAVRKDAALYTVGNSEGDMLPVTVDEQWRGFYIPLPSSVPIELDTKPGGGRFLTAYIRTSPSENLKFDQRAYRSNKS